MNTDMPGRAALEAVTKFLEINDDTPAIQATNRRVFFEALRNGLSLTPTEVQHVAAIADLLHDLSVSRFVTQAR
jgi:hypothetical protein